MKLKCQTKVGVLSLLFPPLNNWLTVEKLLPLSGLFPHLSDQVSVMHLDSALRPEGQRITMSPSSL